MTFPWHTLLVSYFLTFKDFLSQTFFLSWLDPMIFLMSDSFTELSSCPEFSRSMISCAEVFWSQPAFERNSKLPLCYCGSWNPPLSFNASSFLCWELIFVLMVLRSSLPATWIWPHYDSNFGFDVFPDSHKIHSCKAGEDYRLQKIWWYHWGVNSEILTYSSWRNSTTLGF